MLPRTATDECNKRREGEGDTKGRTEGELISDDTLGRNGNERSESDGGGGVCWSMDTTRERQKIHTATPVEVPPTVHTCTRSLI